MPPDTFHDHILNALPAHERNLVLDLVGKVETTYHSTSTPRDRHEPCAWDKTLELIHKDSLRCMQNEILQLNHRNKTFSDGSTPSISDRLTRQAKVANEWCDKVERGLMAAQAELCPHFNTFWTDKALLYLRDLYKSRDLPGQEHAEIGSNGVYRMMVSFYIAVERKATLTQISAGKISAARRSGCHQEAD